VHRVAQFLRLMEQENMANLPFRIVLNRHHDRGEGADVSEAQYCSTVGNNGNTVFLYGVVPRIFWMCSQILASRALKCNSALFASAAGTS